MKKLNLTLCCLFCLTVHGIFTQSFTGIDIWPGAGRSNPLGMISFNGKVYFSAEADSLHGIELWSSDGTQAGTTLVADIWPGPGSGYPSNFVVVGSKLYFSANDSVHGYELWVTDATIDSTYMVTDIWVGPGSGLNDYGENFMTAFNGKLYFAADDSTHGVELWVSDGTAGGTSLVKDIYPGTSSSVPQGFVSNQESLYYTYAFNVINGKLYFRANDGVHGTELWTSDGTTGGTSMVADIWPGPGSSGAYYMTPIGSMFVFGAADSIDGSQLWISDGTTANTSVLKIINPNSSGVGSDVGDNSGFMPFNGKLYFTAYQAATGYELWVTDGTTSGTSMVKDALPGPGSSYAGYDGIGILNGKMYFSANDSVNGYQLWTSDGTAGGTSLFKVLSSYTPYNSTPYDFINYNGSMVFIASTDTINLEQLYITDGTTSGTQLLSPAIAPNADPMHEGAGFCINNDDLFMNANFNSIGDELWVYGFPTGIRSVSGDNTISAYPNPFGSSISVSGLNAGSQYAVQIVDMTGRECYSTEINDASQTTAVSLPELPAGIYLMCISGAGNTQTFKLSKN